jgi:hypothetical protein
MDRPDQTAAHEHSHGAFAYLPEQVGTPGAAISSKGQGSNGRRWLPKDRQDLSKTPEENERIDYNERIMIAGESNCQGGAH